MSYTNKTQPTKISPEKYIKENFIGKEKIQSDALVLIDLFSKVTGLPCVMWNKIFGFGTYQYLDSKGGEHTFFLTGFTVSSGGFTLYNVMGWLTYQEDIKNLGTYKLSGKSCLVIKNLEAIDRKVLKDVVKKSVADMKKKYKTLG